MNTFEIVTSFLSRIYHISSFGGTPLLATLRRYICNLDTLPTSIALINFASVAQFIFLLLQDLGINAP